MPLSAAECLGAPLSGTELPLIVVPMREQRHLRWAVLLEPLVEELAGRRGQLSLNEQRSVESSFRQLARDSPFEGGAGQTQGIGAGLDSDVDDDEKRLY